jgi:hypothetical protein
MLDRGKAGFLKSVYEDRLTPRVGRSRTLWVVEPRRWRKIVTRASDVGVVFFW